MNGNILIIFTSEEGRVLYKSDWAIDWYTDQLIITWALLSRKVCTVPASSNLWQMPGIEFDPAVEDSGSCFHGFGYEQCSKRRVERVERMGCKWWHFWADEGFQAHLDKFYELTNNTITLDPEILGR